MASCSIFKNFHKPIDKKTLLLIAKDIASDKYKSKVEKIRSLIKEGKTEEAQELKKQLPAFTPSAVFKNRRVKEEIETYSGFVHLDFDKLSDEQTGKLRRTISSSPYTHIYFVSPGGRGMKVFVEVTSAMDDHELAYRQVQAYYENLVGLKADPSCKDITRLCFMSYDPDIYRNLESEKFPVRSLEAERSEVPPMRDLVRPLISNPLISNLVFQQQVQFTNRIKAYEEGSRNAYVYQLALNCNRAGLPEATTLELVSGHFDLPAKEREQTVKSAYKHHRDEFNTALIPTSPRAITQNRQTGDSPGKEERTLEAERSEVPLVRDLEGLGGLEGLEAESNEGDLVQPLISNLSQGDVDDPTSVIMPTLPDDVFTTIPGFLKNITSVATTSEERDILLLGSLTTLSVALHKLTGTYRDNIVNANLYLFISASASAGKSILIHCRKLLLPIHEKLREKSKHLRELYEAELSEFRMNKNKDATLQPPQKPPRIMLFIPANNSATGFLKVLNDSYQRGIIFETEGDTVSKTFKTEYGDFSDSFRKAFHHEPISYYRRTDEEYVEIERPCLSVLLSGTQKQIQALIPGTENGLFSRFMFYVMNMNCEWQNVFDSHTAQGLNAHFEQLANVFYDFYQVLELLPEMSFTLTPEQQERFNAYFSKTQNFYLSIQEADIISTVRRLGLIAYRMMMIFSALRLMERGEETSVVVCEDVDFDNTLKIISVLVKHSNHVFTQVAQVPERVKPKNRKEQFLELLPAEFNRPAFLEIGMKLRLSESTVQRYIHGFVKAGVLINMSYGQYKKVVNQ